MREWKLVLMGAILGGAVYGGPLITLNPVNGIISGAPGTTVGWGFSLSNDQGFIVPSAVVFCEGVFSLSCTATDGTFTDFAAQFQVNSVGPGATLTEAFSNANQQGIGSFSINGNTPGGAKDIGTIFVVYDTFSCDITNVSCDPTQTGFSDLVSAPAEVDALGSTAVPEPFTITLAALGFCGILALKAERQGSARDFLDRPFK